MSVLKIVIGIVFVVFGVLLIPTPVPLGAVSIFTGLAIMSSNSKFAKRIVDRVISKFKKEEPNVP